MGASRTVSLMVLLTGDADPDVRGKAESYLRAHMDTHRGMEKEVSSAGVDSGSVRDDALLGDSVALARTLLAMAVGGASSSNVDRTLMSRYESDAARGMLERRLGLTHGAHAHGERAADGDDDNAARRKAILSCSRTRASEPISAAALKFAGRMLDDDPRLFVRACADTEAPEADAAAVSVGTLALAAFADLHRPGSSASPALGAASSLLISLAVRLSLFYDARVDAGGSSGTVSGESESSERRIRSLLSRSMAHACAVLAPTSSGDSTSLGSSNAGGGRASNVQFDIRDRCYGMVCTLARSRFALDDGRALFDRGDNCNETVPLFSNI